MGGDIHEDVFSICSTPKLSNSRKCDGKSMAVHNSFTAHSVDGNSDYDSFKKIHFSTYFAQLSHFARVNVNLSTLVYVLKEDLLAPCCLISGASNNVRLILHLYVHICFM